ncbi:MAG: hypothetical protein NTW06_00310 [Candidatus Falkowbacteria bacterium]|nr:hypothetical protein [Candidatus Falkowbacteria bacterium]
MASLGQIKDIISVLIQAIPAALTKEAAQKIIGNKGRLIKGLQSIFQEIIGATGYDEFLAEMLRFYKEVFGIEADFITDLLIPERQEGFNWLLVMMEGLTPNKLFAKCKERFPSWKYTEDLDTIQSVRKTDRTYAIWLRDREEADEENKNKSAKLCSGSRDPGGDVPHVYWRVGEMCVLCCDPDSSDESLRARAAVSP